MKGRDAGERDRTRTSRRKEILAEYEEEGKEEKEAVRLPF
jgi:hypothetical protein